MAQRLDLHALLIELIGSEDASKRVYFQEPPSYQMIYDCILYKRDRIFTAFADNHPYRHKTRYQVTVISEDPDSELPAKVAELPMCTFDRNYVADNLNHDVFVLYF